MPYISERVCHDADSHIMETTDWLPGYADASIRDRLKPMPLERAGAGVDDDFIGKAVARLKDPVRTAEISRNVIQGPKCWDALGAFDSAERSRALDDLGIRSQLVFPTLSGRQFIDHEDLDVRYGGARALNRGMGEFCRADKRLLGVGMVPLSDPARAVIELREGLKAGCRAFWVPAAPAADKSPGHPDLDPLWAAFCDAGVPFMLHVGPNTVVHPPAYDNNGQPRLADRNGGENIRVKDLMVLSFAPQMFLSSMVFDGAFERFPALRGGVIEMGGGWVPEYLRLLDFGLRSFRKADPYIAALKMAPSDFIRRAVKFTPYPGEDVGRMIRDAGPDLFLFSTDYPHPEGTRDPMGHFERTLQGLDEAARTRFYASNFEQMMGTA